MLAGPIFSREALILPRNWRHYALRAGYVGALIVLMYTAGQATFGWQRVTNLGEQARFGALLFQMLALVELALVTFFAPLFAASRIAQEKDRQTLVLLLMTDLRNRELVAGKMLSSLLNVAVLIATSAPVLMLVSLLGGASFRQIGWCLALIAATALAAGAWGTLVAFWREKTFQTLAVSVLGLALFIGTVEALVALAGDSHLARWMSYADPFRGMLLVLNPLKAQAERGAATVPALPYVLTMCGLALAIGGVTIARLRVWNPSQAAVAPLTEESSAGRIHRGRTRRIWNNPIVWREICTRAYGRKIALIKLAYATLFLFAAFYVDRTSRGDSGLVLGMISPAGFAFVGAALVTLLLVNAQAVTALTSERDAKTLELLLVTDISAREFIYGKLAGILYNTSELLLLPLLGLTWLAGSGGLSWENYLYVVIGFGTLVIFSAMLGLHSGLSFDSSRSAIANSLGTMFFLFLGVFICMMLIVEARSSFSLQLPSFLVFILGGSMALWASLTHKNPSVALTISAFSLPFLTFHSITGFLLGNTLGVCAVMTAAYGFCIVAMLLPAVSEFDVALGRTTLDKG